MTSTVASHPKRSVSSTLASLFRKTSEDFQAENTIDYSQEYSDSGSVIVKKQRRESLEQEGGPFWNGPREVRDDERPNIFLYETDDDFKFRPPILSIEPKQRLRLVQLQQLRRAKQFPKIYRYFENTFSGDAATLFDEVKKDVNGSGMKSLLSTSLSSSIRESSVGLKRKRWMGDFEYDLSEYDMAKKQKKNTDNLLQVPCIDSPKVSQPMMRKSSSMKRSNPYISQSELSPVHLTSVQKKLLSSGTILEDDSLSTETSSSIALKPSIKKQISEQDKLPAKLPSVGFDFINRETSVLDPQNADTPSKSLATSLPFKKIHVDTPSENDRGGKDNKPEQKPLFQPSRIQSDISTEPVLDGPSTILGSKSGFKFDNKEDNTDKKNITTGAKHLKNDPVLSESKPTFSFGSFNGSSNGANLQISINGGDAKSSSAISFGDSTKKAPTISSLSFGGNTPKTANIPSFSFKKETTMEDTDSKSSPLFGSKSDNKNKFVSSNKVDQSENEQRTPSFSFAKSTSLESLERSSEPSSEKKLTETSTSTFVLGKKESSESKTSSFGKKLPSFKFNSTSDKTQASQLSFSLKPETTDGKKDMSSGDVKESSNQTFKFGSTSESKTTQPTFSFGNTATSVEKSASGFDTTNKERQLNGTDSKPTFVFGSNLPTNNSDGLLSSQTSKINGLSQKQPNVGSKFENGGFKTNSSITNSLSPPNPDTTSSVVKPSTTTPFNFGAQLNEGGVTIPQPSKGAFSFGQNTQGVGFGFKNSAINTTSNSPTFDSSSNQPTTFNFRVTSSSLTPQPPSLGSESSNTLQNRSFQPSNSINFNFGGVSSQNPSMIFGNQGSQPNNGIFSSGQNLQSQNPSSIFTRQQSNNSNEGQFPPQRKIAMPGRRRRRG